MDRACRRVCCRQRFELSPPGKEKCLASSKPHGSRITHYASRLTHHKLQNPRNLKSFLSRSGRRIDELFLPTSNF